MTNARHTSARLHLSQFLCRRIRSSIVITVSRKLSSYVRSDGVASSYRPFWYICYEHSRDRLMPPVALYRAVGPAGKRGSKLRRAAEISSNTPGLDLATRLRVFQRALRSRIERRDALVDIVRAVNVSLEPE